MIETERYLSPRENPELVGQDVAEHILLDAWETGRLPNAWLIVGPQGVGKSTIAYRFARFLLSNRIVREGLFNKQLVNLTIDPKSENFKMVASGGHPDLLTLKAGDIHPDTGKTTEGIVVAQVRKAVEFMHLTPALGGWRIVIIDPADAMNTNAANSLLKSLEEPPSRAMFLLISNTPGTLLPTIRSRCRLLSVAPLDDTQISKLLIQFAPQIPDDDRSLLLKLSEGSIGKALAINDAGGLKFYREFVRILGTLPKLDVPAVHALGDKLARNNANEDFLTFIGLVERWLTGMIRYAATGLPIMETVPGEKTIVQIMVGTARLEDWLTVWDKVNHLLSRAINTNLERKQVIIGIFFMLASASR